MSKRKIKHYQKRKNKKLCQPCWKENETKEVGDYTWPHMKNKIRIYYFRYCEECDWEYGTGDWDGYY